MISFHSSIDRKISSIILLAVLCSSVVSGVFSTSSLARSQSQLPLPMNVVFNEVAWGGTAANDNHEWIELYNRDSVDIDLTGWKIQSVSPALEVTLSGTIPAGSYYLIEKNENATSIPADLIFSGLLLSDSGMSLSLYNSDTSPLLIDNANADGGLWPAGQNDQVRCTMERIPGQSFETDSSWVSNNNVYKNGLDANGTPLCGSPKSSNSTLYPTITPTFTYTPTLTFTPSPTSTFTQTSTPTPQFTAQSARSLVINEIAWMGTINLDKIPYPNDEWLELYNPTDKTIKLDGWLLRSDDSVFGVDLAGEIPAGGYFLLERSDDNVISTIKADQIYYSNPLSNNGESLRLIDPSGSIIDTANRAGSVWPAGNTVSACSMERSGASKIDGPGVWFTSAGGTYTARGRDGNLICGSPKARNWAYSVTTTPTVFASRTPTVTPTGFIPSSVIINEFVVQPREDFNGDGKINSGDSFIELINLSSSRVSLKNWRLDDQAFDSSPYFISDETINANSRIVFFNQDTNLFLSSGSDSVRLFKNNQTLVDVFTYTFNPEPGPSWCRFRDGYGPWTFGCDASPNKVNTMSEATVPASTSGTKPEKCSLVDYPEFIQFAECEAMNTFQSIRGNLTNLFKYLPTIIDLGNIQFILE